MRITTWCLRFINNVRSERKCFEFLTATEIADASDLWVKRECSQDVFNAIVDGGKHHLIPQLGIYADSSNVLRCYGKFSGLQVHPKLLPKDSQYTKRCIVRAHIRLLHAGVSHTVARVRKEHWVIQGRSAVRKVVRHCLICLHCDGGPFKTFPFSNFPDYVWSPNLLPFTSLGLDYLGPIVVKDEPQVTKNWICLFTYLNTRA